MDSNYPNFMVSIQCITYNHAPYIEDAMKGFCMQQTVFPYDTIIIDDASTDGEPDIIRHYLNTHFNMIEAQEWETEDAYYIYARHKDNKNCYFAVILLKYNFYSIKKSKEPLYKEFEGTTKYIALCEGDDYWTDSLKLQKQYDILECHPNCSFCIHDYTEYLQHEGRFKKHQFPISSYKGNGIVLDIHFYLNGPFFTKTLTVLYRKDALQLSNYLKYDILIDMTMFFALFTQGNAYLMTDVMGCYRIHNGGIYSGKDRLPLLRDFFSNIFSICREEKSRNAQRFVYNFVAPYALSELISQKGIFVKNCFNYLGMYGVILFFYKVPQLIIKILLGKVGIKVKPDYLRI